LSALKAWIEDDYGDGAISHLLFGSDIPLEQKKAADRTRKLIAERVRPWSYWQNLLGEEEIPEEEKSKVTTISTRVLTVQWVKGDADKAESSFFNINMQGTALDPIEEMLLRSRNKPSAIAARAIIRAGKGHRYWSSFSEENTEKIEEHSLELHKLLFNPEVDNPIKTLDLPLGGSKGVSTALKVLIEFILIGNSGQKDKVKSLGEFDDDLDGSGTIEVLRNSLSLAKRITGNDKGSLGLHPAIYFYGPSGKHMSPMFLGTVSLIAEKLQNNDKEFFKKFTEVREKLESLLYEMKPPLALIIQRHGGPQRAKKYHELLDNIIKELVKGNDVDLDALIKLSKVSGRFFEGKVDKESKKFSKDTKSKAFLDTALKTALKCNICNGYLDVSKSVSYDHIKRVEDGGVGEDDNCQLTHPYCNQSVKN
jgi:hypothetical protein